MDILATVLAFLSVMIVFSTVVTVAVEAMHKGFRLRRSGLEEMLRALYAQALAPRIGGADAAEAKTFAKDVTKNHAFAGEGRFWWLRNIPVISGIFHGGFERLSTLQFAEQLARTEVGARMARDLGSDRLKSVLAATAYEFERFGDSQSDYFRRRAKALSVLAGIVVAFAMNIDAVTLFKGLAANPQAQLAAIAQLEQAQAAPGAAVMPAAAGQSDLAAARADLMAFGRQAAALSAAGLPIGAVTFPYCAPTAEGGAVVDPRCLAAGDRPAAAPARLFLVDDPGEHVLKNDDWGAFYANLARTPGDAVVWFVSILATGGLLGLGAPFWFNAFRRLASLAGPAAARLANLPAAPVEAAPAQARDRAATDVEALHRAFVIASGGDVPGPGLSASAADWPAAWTGPSGPGAEVGPSAPAQPAPVIARVLRE